MPAPTTENSSRVTSENELISQPAGIVERLVRDDHDRKRFLKMVGGAGAASFGAFVLAACGSSKSSSSKSTSTGSTVASTSTGTATTAATNPFGAGDIGILNYALTLEYLETEFYKKVVAAKMFSGKVGALLEDFSKQEQSHVIALTAAIKGAGGKTAAKPNGTFPITSPTQVAMLAYTVENLGASAYILDRQQTSKASRCWPRRLRFTRSRRVMPQRSARS